MSMQVVVPTTLQEVVCEQLHNNNGHLGITKTLDNVKRRFYWPGYEDYIKAWLQHCEKCQKRNPPQPHPCAPLGRIIANHPFQVVTWDIMGPLPASSRGNKYVLAITDVFTKWVEAFPTKSTDTETLATILTNEIVCRYGVPEKLHSDQGANLTSKMIQSLCEKLGIKRTQSSAYHPQGNGQVEP
jgi:transposase InsO family protein